MYFQIAFVTSTLLNFFAPQIAAKAGLRVFGAKRPMPFAFAFFAFAFEAALRLRRTCARCAVLALNDMPFFVVLTVVLTVVFLVVVVFVISVGGSREQCTRK